MFKVMNLHEVLKAGITRSARYPNCIRKTAEENVGRLNRGEKVSMYWHDPRGDIFSEDYCYLVEVGNEMWVVWKQFGGVPTVTHSTREEAETEARRLSSIHNGFKFLVARVTTGFLTPTPAKPETQELTLAQI